MLRLVLAAYGAVQVKAQREDFKFATCWLRHRATTSGSCGLDRLLGGVA